MNLEKKFSDYKYRNLYKIFNAIYILVLNSTVLYMEFFFLYQWTGNGRATSEMKGKRVGREWYSIINAKGEMWTPNLI